MASATSAAGVPSAPSLTTREANGRDSLPGSNARIAFVLTLLTGGFGYFYLG